MILFDTKHDKGEYGYLTERKLQAVCRLVCCILLGLLFLWISIIVPNERASKLLLVASVVTVLPGAAALVSCIMVLPVRVISKERKAFIESYVRPGDIVLYDIVFTSKENRMHLEALIISDHQAVGFTSSRFDKPDMINRYFKTEFANRKIDFVSFVTNDQKAFENRMNMRLDKEQEKESSSAKKVVEFIKVAIY